MPKERAIYIPPGGPPQGILPGSEIYGKMGEEAIYKMLEDFYLELGKSSISHLFPRNVKEASKKSAAFFVFILGGPPIYQQQFGAPKMRQRHLPFVIDERARLVWLECFSHVLKDADKKYGFPMEHMERFLIYLEKFSAWMVNTE